MMSQKDIAAALYGQLPQELYPHIPTLARLLEESSRTGQAPANANAELRPLLEYLAGRLVGEDGFEKIVISIA